LETLHLIKNYTAEENVYEESPYPAAVPSFNQHPIFRVGTVQSQHSVKCTLLCMRPRFKVLQHYHHHLEENSSRIKLSLQILFKVNSGRAMTCTCKTTMPKQSVCLILFGMIPRINLKDKLKETEAQKEKGSPWVGWVKLCFLTVPTIEKVQEQSIDAYSILSSIADIY
jgi:hypothetical protein